MSISRLSFNPRIVLASDVARAGDDLILRRFAATGPAWREPEERTGAQSWIASFVVVGRIGWPADSETLLTDVTNR
jgi:hypothetical protein